VQNDVHNDTDTQPLSRTRSRAITFRTPDGAEIGVKGAKQMNDWPRQIGKKHQRRDEAASLRTKAIIDGEHERSAACRVRWPMILAAIRALTEEYNTGFGLAVVVVVEGSDLEHPSVTLQSVVSEHSTLGITVDGPELLVHTRGSAGSSESARWVALNRTDEDTAAYLVQDWMQRL
jgi:hypothetical protein